MYRNLVSATTPIESGLHKQLAAHLNSEIVLHTINDFADAMKWMRSTFLYVRAVANPTYYGIQSKCAIAIENELKGKTQLCRCCDERWNEKPTIADGASCEIIRTQNQCAKLRNYQNVNSHQFAIYHKFAKLNIHWLALYRHPARSHLICINWIKCNGGLEPSCRQVLQVKHENRVTQPLEEKNKVRSFDIWFFVSLHQQNISGSLYILSICFSPQKCVWQIFAYYTKQI